MKIKIKINWKKGISITDNQKKRWNIALLRLEAYLREANNISLDQAHR